MLGHSDNNTTKAIGPQVLILSKFSIFLPLGSINNFWAVVLHMWQTSQHQNWNTIRTLDRNIKIK